MDYTVLILGNYGPDGQRSMFRFRELLASGLQKHGVSVEVYNPPVIIGKLGAGTSGLGKWIGYIDKYLLCPFFLKRKLVSIHGKRIIHIVDHSNAFYCKVLSNEATIVTCHDLLAVRSALGEFKENRPGFTGKQQQVMTLNGLKQSRCIASVSSATRDDVQRLVGLKEAWQHLVPNALDTDFINEALLLPVNHDVSLPDDLLKLRYVMHIGGEKWYKNRSLMLRTFYNLYRRDPKLRLVVVGPRFTETQLEAAGLRAADPSPILYLSGISDAQLRAVYRHAEMLLFLSLIEGFGWPILEAQACGCPVATLDRAPMNELNASKQLILSGCPSSAGWMVEASDRCMEFLNQSDSAKIANKEMIRKFSAGFTNEVSVQAYMDLYDKVLTEAAR